MASYKSSQTINPTLSQNISCTIHDWGLHHIPSSQTIYQHINWNGYEKFWYSLKIHDLMNVEDSALKLTNKMYIRTWLFCSTLKCINCKRVADLLNIIVKGITYCSSLAICIVVKASFSFHKLIPKTLKWLPYILICHCR